MRRLAPAVVTTAFLVFAPAAAPMPLTMHAVTHTRAGSRRTRFTIAVPDPGDASYAIAQIRISGPSRRVARRLGDGHAIFRQRVGGLAMIARSARWRALRRDTHVYAVVGSGASPGVRTILVFVTRRKTPAARRHPGRVEIDIPNAAPVAGSYFGRGVDRHGFARIFKVRDVVATDLGNWAHYIAVIKAAHAVQAALHAINIAPPAVVRQRGIAAARASSAGGSGHLWVGGQRLTSAGRGLFRLLFGTLRDPAAYGAAKNSPLVPDYIEHQLNNPPLARRWRRIVSELPSSVPDKYAASAQEEAKFEKVRAPHISRHLVRIADTSNSAENAQKLVNDVQDAPTSPGDSVHASFDGDPQLTGDITISSTDGQLSCVIDKNGTGSGTCQRIYSSGQLLELEAVTPAGWKPAKWTLTEFDANDDVVSRPSCLPSPDSGCIIRITNTNGIDRLDAVLNIVQASGAGGAGQTLPSSESVIVKKVGEGHVTSSPPGIDCGFACSYFVKAGDSITLVADPDPGYTFGSWQGACSELNGNQCAVNYAGGSPGTVPQVNLTATFVPVAPAQTSGSSGSAATHTLTVSTAGSGTGHVTSSPAGIDCLTRCVDAATFSEGQTVTLTSTPDSGSNSVGFTGCDSNTLTTCNVALASDRSVRAIFGRPTYSCTCTYTFHNLVGSFGTATNTNASGPEGVSITNSLVWVAETSNDRIDEFSPTGTSALFSFGDSSVFDTPRQAVFDPYAGRIDVSDSFNGRVAQFNNGGDHVKDFAGSFSLPRGIAVDQGSGTVAVADAGNNEILEFASDGTGTGLLTSYGTSHTTFNGPEGVAFDSNGFLWIADTQANKVEEFNQGGTLLTSWTVPSTDGMANPTGIATDPDGHVFLASFSADRVIEYTQGGSYVATIAGFGNANGQVNGPVTLAVDQTNGDLYVADEGNDRVQRFVVG